MKELFSYKPDQKEVQYFTVMDGKKTIVTLQDVSSHLDYAAACRQDDDGKAGVKRGWMHHAHIPMSLIGHWFNEGINPYRREYWDKCFYELETKYSQFKVTSLKHFIGKTMGRQHYT